MRVLLPLLALSALAPGQVEAPKIRYGFFPEIQKGVTPDERRALIVARALWESAAGEGFVRGFTEFRVRKVGDAWLVTTSVPPHSDTVSIEDGNAYFAFDARDGGFFYESRYNPPRDRDLVELLRRRRAVVKRGLE